MGQRLLVVDSDRRFVEEHRDALLGAFDTEFMYSIEGALTRLETGDFAAILLCVETSEQKGYALSSAIRRSPVLGDLKVALISAKATEEEYARHRNTKGRADLYLIKPVAPKELVSHLAALLPARLEDPDNPLGDLTGPDLGEEWLESLKTELDADPPKATPRAPIALPESVGADPILPFPALEPPPAPFLVEPGVVHLPDDLPETPDPLASLDPFAPLPAAPASTPAPVLNLSPLPPELERGLLDPLEWRVKDLEFRLAGKTEELDLKSREMIDLLHRHDAVTRSLDESTQWRREADVLRQKLQGAEGDLRRLETEGAKLRARVEEEVALVAEKVRHNEELINANAELTLQLQDLRREQEHKDSELTFLQERIGFQDSALQEQEELRAALQAERDHLDEALADQAGAALALQERVAALEQAVRAQEEEKARLEADHEAQQLELLAGIDEREARLGRMATQLDAQREHIAELETERNRLADGVAARDERLAALAGAASELETKLRQVGDLAGAPFD